MFQKTKVQSLLEVLSGDTTGDYIKYVKPAVGRMLRLLKLDTKYIDGSGNWLVLVQEDGETRRVFDATGGYGSNLLGHRNPVMVQTAIEAITTLTPNLTQGTIRFETVELAKKLSTLLELETGLGQWTTNFSNSGTEAVEAALKHALIRHHEKIEKLKVEAQVPINSSLRVVRLLSKGERLYLRIQLLKDLAGEGLLDETGVGWLDDIETVIDKIHQYNATVLNEKPVFIALSGAFHGKSLGSLQVTENPTYRDSFYASSQNIQTRFIDRRNPEQAARAIKELQRPLIGFKKSQGKLALDLRFLAPVAGLIVEPIQGEAGVYEIGALALNRFRELADEHDFLLIFDEIQAGMFRTGKLASGSNYNCTADVYTFSKALGGGIVKIGATCFLSSKYEQKFGVLHTSTFAEDTLSSKVAIAALDQAHSLSQNLSQDASVSAYLKTGLDQLVADFPETLREVRGLGMILALQLQETLQQICYEYKFVADLGLFGHFMSSALLHHESLRIAPTLSNQFTLRIEPSLETTQEECDFLIAALRRMVVALQNLDIQYFFGHLFSPYPLLAAGRILTNTRSKRQNARAKVVFLNHLINVDSLKQTMPSLNNVPDELLEQLIETASDLMEFQVYYETPLKGERGTEVDLLMMYLPMTSQVIVNMASDPGRSHSLCLKIQRALAHAKDLGASTVGLGQFTSIVTQNGLTLDPLGMNLTTGNAYTVSLSVEAGLLACKKHRQSSKTMNVGCVGAAGNIISVTASLIADHCRRVTLFYHTPLAESPKLMRSVRTILDDIRNSNANSICIQGLKPLLKRRFPRSKPTSEQLIQFLNEDNVREFFRIESGLDALVECDLIFTGTNSSGPIIESCHLKSKAVVIDLAVPNNVGPETREARPDVIVVDGGIAALPSPGGKTQAIEMPSFPLKKGESYACLAETIGIALNGLENRLNTGHLTKDQILETTRLQKRVGFKLGRFKTEKVR